MVTQDTTAQMARQAPAEPRHAGTIGFERQAIALVRGEEFETLSPSMLNFALDAWCIVQIGRRDEKFIRGDVFEALQNALPDHDTEVHRGLLGSYVLARHVLTFMQGGSRHGHMSVQCLRGCIARLVGLAHHEELAVDGVLAALCAKRHAVWLNAEWLQVRGISLVTNELYLPAKVPPILVWSDTASTEERLSRRLGQWS
ncbi:MAG: hypothetical protein JO356_03930 [Acidobacteria bacterium]|nr:hypothetical protein [Acidobacteriota bacterium]